MRVNLSFGSSVAQDHDIILIMKVAVGSENPVKIQAVAEAFEKVWPKKKFEVIGTKVPSGVSDQPMSDEESKGCYQSG